MAKRGSNFSVGSMAEGSGGRLKSGSGSGGPERKAAEVRQGGGGEVNLGERWFILETSSAE